MSIYRYVTNRVLLSNAGEEKGRIRVMVKKESTTAEGDYACPECDSKGKINQVFKRPFSVRCENCTFLMKLPKLKNKK